MTGQSRHRWQMNSSNRNLAIVKAVRGQGEPVVKVAQRFGISRQRVYKILSDFDSGGAQAIALKSRAPHTHPNAVPETLRNQIIDMRKEFTQAGFDAGPDTIAFHRGRQGMRVPSTSKIRRIITDAGLVSPQPQKKPHSCYIRFEAAMPNECWQADITPPLPCRPLPLPAINHCPSSAFRTSRCCRTPTPHRHLRPTSIHVHRQRAGVYRPISRGQRRTQRV